MDFYLFFNTKKGRGEKAYTYILKLHEAFYEAAHVHGRIHPIIISHAAF